MAYLKVMCSEELTQCFPTFFLWRTPTYEAVQRSEKLDFGERSVIAAKLLSSKLVNSSVFRRVRKIAKSVYLLRRVRLSVRMAQLGSHWTDFDET
jgi:hypothetical protein